MYDAQWLTPSRDLLRLVDREGGVKVFEAGVPGWPEVCEGLEIADYQPPPPEVQPPPVVSRIALRFALGEAECARADSFAADPDTPFGPSETIRSRAVWRRAGPEADELAWVLGYDAAQLDLLFLAALTCED